MTELVSKESQATAARDPEEPPRDRQRGAVLTLAFGTAVAMWAAAYLCRLPMIGAPPALLGALFALALGVGGFLSGRWGLGVGGGAQVGAAASLINLLILGSFLADGGRHAAAWVPGTIALGAILGALGALVARGLGLTVAPQPPSWGAAFARVAAVATFLLLAVGGLVTSKEAGLAVPDWPNSFTANMFLYPLSKMTGGIYYEHAHRLFGSLVGLTTLALAVHVQRSDGRAWLRRLSWGAFALVCVQGLLGGLRVTGGLTLSAAREELAPSVELAVVHGVNGQLFFALLLALTAFLTPTWQSLPEPGPAADAEAAEAAETTRAWSTWLVGLVFLQLVLGALVRHLDWSVTLHISLGTIVLLLAIGTGVRAWGRHPELPVLPTVGLALAAAVCLQFLLGIGALATTALEAGESVLSAYQVPATTAHQSWGALVLGCAVLLRVWVERVLPPSREEPPPGP